MQLFRIGVVGAVFTASSLASVSADAYCALYTCKDVSVADAKESLNLEPYTCERTNGCISEGHQLFWDSKCLTFGVSGLNTRSLGLTPEEFDDIIVDSFKVWENVDCGGGKSPGLKVQSVGVVDSNGDFFCEEEPRANLSVWSLVTRWDRSSDALGFTSSTHNRKDGEVFDADVELNLNKIANDSISPADYAIMLGKIATHEAGHFLGLAHSQDQEAVMFARYDTDDLFNRELNQDDIDGICALYPPDDDLKCSKPGYVAAGLNQEACDEAALERSSSGQDVGCSLVRVRGHNDRTSWSLVAMALAAVLVARRRHA